jgi:hypothetical protein
LFCFEGIAIAIIILLASRWKEALDVTAKVVGIVAAGTIINNNWFKKSSSTSSDDDDINKKTKIKKKIQNHQ